MHPDKHRTKGAIAWMTRNHVTANLLMLGLILGGAAITLFRIKQEVFPDLQLDFIFVNAPYPGASPEEVEEGVVLAIEEEVRGLEDVKEVTSTCREGMGVVAVELLMGANPNKALSDVKNAVDRITTFPQDMERYTVSLVESRRQVISLVLHGQQSEANLRQLGEQVREELIQKPGITQVELSGVRRPEIAIEIPQENLRRYGLTLDQAAARIRQASLDLPGGRVQAQEGEVLVRTKERRYYAREYEDLPLIASPDGTEVTVAEIAEVRDTFEESDISAQYNGEPAVRVDVYRVGDETPTAIAKTVYAYVDDLNQRLPSTVQAAVWEDYSEILRDRIGLLVKNAILGLILVLILLGLSLDIRLAFWVTMGIPTSILGAILFFPLMDMSINMISLFAIIITIGIVVDDAIIVGENVFHMRRKGLPFVDAAIEGARQMAVPVTFAIATNVAAFMPLMFVPGVTGKIFKVIPTAVITIFLMSLVEALLILPAHLSTRSKAEERGWLAFLNRRREWFGKMLIWFRNHTFKPSLHIALRWRYLTVALALGLLIFCIGLVKSGRIDFSFMPKIEHDRITANLTMPVGTPVEQTREVQKQLLAAAESIIDENGGESIVKGIFSLVGSPPPAQGMVNVGSGATGSHLTNVSVYLVPVDERSINAESFVRQWYDRMADVPGIDTLTFRYTTGPSSNQPIALMISHKDTEKLEAAAADLARALQGYSGVRDIDDGFTGGKKQLDFKIKPAAQALGLTAADLGRQVRAAFYGAEALRVQRKRDEVKVLVRLPRNERTRLYSVEELVVRAPNGTEMPLRDAAEVIHGSSYTEIQRSDGRRVLNITADVIQGMANADKVTASVRKNELPAIMSKYPGLQFELSGEQEDKMDAMKALGFGFLLTLFVIYTLLAIPFKSYTQPFIIMTCIPFGIIGAVGGHMLMGFELSIISMFGIIALSGVVVNDSLILIDAANQNRWDGAPHFKAIFDAAIRRFRPIVLTSLTTFLGLAPMIFETSLQARFLIPMAISLGFGILFATLVALMLIPALYMILVDIKRLLGIEDQEEASTQLTSNGELILQPE